MTKKKAEDQDEPRFVVKKRIPKEKPNFFQNIPSLKHPLAQIMKFPAEQSDTPEISVTGQIVDSTESINNLLIDSTSPNSTQDHPTPTKTGQDYPTHPKQK
jgi:hypothetical protein